MTDNRHKTGTLTSGISTAAAWAFSVGTAIGWGSLVVTNNTYLGQAGPLGSVLGMVIGAVVMLIVSKNYSYLMNAFPEAGGAYSYSREIFGYDHGFLTSWFLILTYLAILWANVTSLPLFARYFLGDIFRFGKLYTLFGYDVYIGEVLLSIAAIVLFSLFCARFKNAASASMTVMVILFTVGIVVCFAASVVKKDSAFTMSPAFVPGNGAFSQVMKIACISPWAFIGFESISHGVEEFKFKRTRIFKILAASVIAATLLYIFIMLMSVTAYPPEYSSWLEYINDLNNLSGIKALPAFYAAQHYMGSAGVTLLMLSLLSLIFTSLIGNITALSRLFYSLAKDDIFPRGFSSVNKHGIPSRSVGFIAAVSIIIPFLGRTAIGWIVDVTTLGATIVYCFVSASSFKLARKRDDRIEKITGFVGLVICADFGLYILLPNLFTTGAMETESFFLFVAWSVLGFIFFHNILKHDKKSRFGQSIVVWISLLSLVLFISLVWMSRSIMDATDKGMSVIRDYYTGTDVTAGPSEILSSQMTLVHIAAARSIVIVILLFGISLGILLNNYSLMSRRAIDSEQKLGLVQEKAYRDSLTGVKSKLAYAEKEQEINQSIENTEAEEFAVVVCDVNGLKHVNDTMGHKAGDDYIRSAAHLICGIFAHSPVYRTGGDEFVVILTGADYDNRKELLAALHHTSVENIGTGRVVVSGGLADFVPGSTESYHSVFARADELMYEEKKLLKSMGSVSR